MVYILLIEDDENIALGLRYFLENEGFLVKWAADAGEGLQMLEAGNFQMLILDVTLPDGNGFELINHLKRKRDLPVIFLTALDGEEEIVKGFELGAEEYITKPFRPRELLVRIKNVARRAGILEEMKKEVQIENIRINLEQGVVYKNDEKVELTALEYKIFVFFCENRGRVLTRTQILAYIWDASEHFVNDNTLTVYIKRLREKIEENPNQPKIIQTVRGMGYKIGG